MKQGLIITGGCLDMDFASSYIKSHVFDTVIAVDAGLEKALKLGLHVDAAVGDFDTLSKNLWEEYRKHTEISWDVHKPEKDETDTELAITTAMKRGCQSPVSYTHLEALIVSANDNGGRDNIAVILIDPQVSEVSVC